MDLWIERPASSGSEALYRLLTGAIGGWISLAVQITRESGQWPKVHLGRHIRVGHDVRIHLRPRSHGMASIKLEAMTVGDMHVTHDVTAWIFVEQILHVRLTRDGCGAADSAGRFGTGAGFRPDGRRVIGLWFCDGHAC